MVLPPKGIPVQMGVSVTRPTLGEQTLVVHFGSVDAFDTPASANSFRLTRTGELRRHIEVGASANLGATAPCLRNYFPIGALASRADGVAS
jgi:hypothetical protein